MPLVAGWLAAGENCRWLDFGQGVRVPGELAIRVMLRRPLHVMRLYTAADDPTPIGVVALSDVDREFKTARLWYVLGDKRFAARGYTSRAVSDLLREAFDAMGLQAISAWAVAENIPSIRVLEGNGFRYIGRQRRCHYVDGHAADRLLFDLLASEYERRRDA